MNNHSVTNTALSDPLNTHAAQALIEAEVLKHLRSVRYGQITVQIHDGRIVQIERTEKIRPDHRAGDPRQS